MFEEIQRIVAEAGLVVSQDYQEVATLENGLCAHGGVFRQATDHVLSLDGPYVPSHYLNRLDSPSFEVSRRVAALLRAKGYAVIGDEDDPTTQSHPRLIVAEPGFQCECGGKGYVRDASGTVWWCAEDVGRRMAHHLMRLLEESAKSTV